MTRHAQTKRNRGGLGLQLRVGAVACAGALMLAASLPLAAHHSFSAEFDGTKGLKVTGEVTNVEWENPHAWIHVGVKEVCERTATPGRGGGPGGSGDDEPDWNCRMTDVNAPEDWGFELGSPNGLMRQGWTRHSLNLGDTVTIVGSRARDDSNNGNARSVTLADGTRLFAGSSERSTP
jgi:Family of unknown function (DUF6152)